ncbi:unnamed protein product [Blepharisma stoltei]|uniref:Uncharacterized protein n=1 Tax=Blepharisma stoltei TaxID=1481888 RepID=A0AAU9JI16_9CILI|nr:unnamed protein product [Blepharisma stoltei]
MKPQGSRLNISNSSSSNYGNRQAMLYSSGTYESLGSLNGFDSQKKACPGDFCNYIVINKDINYKEEIDYDELLRKVKKAYSSEGDKETTSIKLGIAVDYMIKEMDKMRCKTEKRVVPYKYLILGRQLLQRSNISLNPKGLKGIDFSELFHPLSNRGPDVEKLQLRNFAMKFPFKYYQSVKVCERCYQVYCLLILSQKIQLKNDIMKSQKSFERSIHSFPTDYSQKDLSRSTIKSFRTPNPKLELKEIVESPIGPINANNIDDLLADMNHALVDMEVKSFDYKKEAKEIFGSMTESRKKLIQIKVAEEKKKQKPLIHPQAIEDIKIQDDLTLNFIPAANMQRMTMKTKEEKADIAWARYNAMIEMERIKKKKRAKSHRIRIRC